MKLYSLTNMYQSGAQVGIQTQHAVTRMLMKYRTTNPYVELDMIDMVDSWAIDHETTIILKGGDHHKLQSIHNEILALGDSFQYPYAYFQEPGLNDSYTSVCFILDQYALDAMGDVRESRDDSVMRQYYGDAMSEFMLRIMKMPLAG